MKLSEKTLELNICAQVSSHLRGRAKPFWFGLTQKQEAKAGFDACTKLNGRLLIFQFKASNNVLKNGDRKFLAPHYQMSALSRVAGSMARSVFYAFPLVGNTLEIKDGTLRLNGCHNIYVRKGSATIHSDPVETSLLSMKEFVSEGFPGSDGFQWVFNGNADFFWEFCSILGPGARGMFLYD
jgi:hypothetical protein